MQTNCIVVVLFQKNKTPLLFDGGTVVLHPLKLLELTWSNPESVTGETDPD